MKKIIYEYGAGSSKYVLEAASKLTAYAAMVLHYKNSPNLVVIYTPEECSNDTWFNMNGKTAEKLDILFGGVGSFENYLHSNIEDIRACYKSIKQLI